MLQIIRFLKGYLSIKVWGFSTERFINLCGNHNILLWDIVNHGDYYTMCISLKGFYQLKSITKNRNKGSRNLALRTTFSYSKNEKKKDISCRFMRKCFVLDLDVWIYLECRYTRQSLYHR